MARIEKTVFISYRRTDVYTALAVYETLKNRGYDVFFDYRSISSGDFEQIITSNIRARAYFLLILTPTALDRLNEPGDWLRREIEVAIDEKRNIVPLFFKGFRFGASSKSGISKWLQLGTPDVLTGTLKDLSRYNGLNVHEDYFEEAMNRLRTEFLSKPLNTVLHPVTTEVRKVVKEEQEAADEAIKHKDEIREGAKPSDEKTDKPRGDSPPPLVQPASNVHSQKPKIEEKSFNEKAKELEKLKYQAIQYELLGDFWNAQQTYQKIKKHDPDFPHVDAKIEEMERELQPQTGVASSVSPGRTVLGKEIPWHLIGKLVGITVLLMIFIWGGISFWNYLSSSSNKLTQTTQIASQQAPPSIITNTISPTITSNPGTSIPEFDIGSTMTGKDGMNLLYVPAGEFIMGGEGDLVYLDAFWIDQTEVSNAMYAECVNADICDPPRFTKSYTRDSYFGNSEYNDYPVIYVDWEMAKNYCEWVDRRLPTDTEWEKAARGTDGNIYPWGDTFEGNLLNFCDRNCTYSWANQSFDDGFADTAPVSHYPAGASPYGVLNMVGNVKEWVSDSEFSDIGIEVVRGGSWYHKETNVDTLRSPIIDPSSKDSQIGFRCAMDASLDLAHSPPTATRTPQPVQTNALAVTFIPKPSITNPQDEPLSTWNDIPIMPLAVKGSDPDNDDEYSFTVQATSLEVISYYDENLMLLGWTTNRRPLTSPLYTLQAYDKVGIEKPLRILIESQGDLSLVILGF